MGFCICDQQIALKSSVFSFLRHSSHGLYRSSSALRDCEYFVANVRNLSPVDDFRAGLLHILSGISSSVRHLGHRSDRLHPRQKYVNFSCSFILKWSNYILICMHADTCVAQGVPAVFSVVSDRIIIRHQVFVCFASCICVCFAACISTVVCDVAEKAKLLMDCVSGTQHSLKTLILMEEFDADLVSRGQRCGIDIISLKDAEVNKPQTVCSNLYIRVRSMRVFASAGICLSCRDPGTDQLW